MIAICLNPYFNGTMYLILDYKNHTLKVIECLNPYSNRWSRPYETSKEVLLFVTEGGAQRHLRHAHSPHEIEPRRGSTIHPTVRPLRGRGRWSGYASAGVASLHQTVTYLRRFHRPAPSL